MNNEQFAHQLGEISGQLKSIISQNNHQLDQLGKLDNKIDGVRSSLSAKIDVETAKIHTRIDGHDNRLRAVETDGAKRSATVAVLAGGGSGLAVSALVIGIKALFKIGP